METKAGEEKRQSGCRGLEGGGWGGVGVGWQKVRGRVERNGENKRGENRRENKQKKKKNGGKRFKTLALQADGTYRGTMFTNGHHQSSTHVARAISRHTRKIKERHKENRGKWNISAGDCRSTPSLQTMLSTQSFVIVGSRCTPRLRKHTLSCLLYTISKISKKGNYSFLYEKKNALKWKQIKKRCRQNLFLFLLYRGDEETGNTETET